LLQLEPIKIVAAPIPLGDIVGPVQPARVHVSPERSVTLYARSVIGVLPLLRRDRVILVEEVRENVNRLNDSGTGSTTLTVRIHEWLTVPLDPIIVMLYLPKTVDSVVDTCRLVLVTDPEASVTGFWPPITPRNPKGTIAERVTEPLKPFLLDMTMLVELANPATTVIE